MKNLVRDSITQITNSGKWREYVDFLALNATRYSARNTLLLFCQCPHATYVAGEKQWAKKNRKPIHGERAISLLAPQFEEFTAKLSNGETEQVKKLVGYKEVYVYDISQTELTTSKQPTASVSLGETQFLKCRADKIWELLNKHFHITEQTMDADALIVYSENKVVVNKELSTVLKVKAALHEIGHLLLHKGVNLPRQTREIEAELFSYICMKHFGISATFAFSANYIAEWVKMTGENTLVVRIGKLEKILITFFQTIERS